MTKKLLTLKASISKEKEDGLYKIWASTIKPDLQGDIVEPEAFKNLASWLSDAKGRILYGHSWVKYGIPAAESLTIGKAVAAEIVKGEGVRMSFRFAESPLCDQLKWLADNDFALFASIGGMAKETLEEHMPSGQTLRRIKDFHLIEVSLVTVPANDGAQFIKGLKVAGMAAKATSILEELEAFNRKLESPVKGVDESGGLKALALRLAEIHIRRQKNA